MSKLRVWWILWNIIGVKPVLCQAVLKHVVSKDFIFKKSMQGANSVSYQEWRNLWHCSISKIFMSCYITFKKKTSTCGSKVGHMWITSAFFCVSGSNGLTGATHFQSWCVCACTCVCVLNVYMCVCACVSLHVCMCVYVYVCMHVYKYTTECYNSKIWYSLKINNFLCEGVFI